MTTTETNSGRLNASDAHQQDWQQIQDALRGLRYGSVNIIVQDGVIVQVDRTEKRRLRYTGSHNSAANNQQRAC